MNLHNVQTPALILDADILERNCAAMKERARAFGVALRPHLKTGKCREIARRQMSSPEGPATVSTLLEAEKFFSYGVKDIVYAVGLTPGKFDRAAALRAAGCDLKVILDNVPAAKALSEYCGRRQIRIPVLIEIDCDGHRSGVKANSALLLDIAAALKNGAELTGVLTHAGDSYKCYGQAAVAAAAEQERAQTVLAASRLKEAGYPIRIVSVGSTPTAVFSQNWEGVTELRCGVYCVFDLFMHGLGVCALEDIALSLLVEVIGHQEEKGWIITDGGWMALSRDRGTASQPVDQGYGLVCDINGKPFNELIVSATNQEHGIITRRDGNAADISAFPVGTRLRILPNHACATAAQHPCYQVVRGGTDILAAWTRFYGWF